MKENNQASGKLDQLTATTLLEDLQSTDIKTKKNAVQNLRGISLALGRERTRKELLPYLKSCIDEEEDEIIIELSKVLSNFIDCIGGKQYIKELFNLLEVIFTIDEPFVRKETINTIKLIVNQIGKVNVQGSGKLGKSSWALKTGEIYYIMVSGHYYGSCYKGSYWIAFNSNGEEPNQ